MSGHLIAFEGLDQSGKQTQAEMLRDHLKAQGRKARLVSFPDYGTSIGEEIARALSNALRRQPLREESGFAAVARGRPDAGVRPLHGV